MTACLTGGEGCGEITCCAEDVLRLLERLRDRGRGDRCARLCEWPVHVLTNASCSTAAATKARFSAADRWKGACDVGTDRARG